MEQVIRKRQMDDLLYEKTVLATELYYLYNLNQEQVSKQLGISRPGVSRLLKHAVEIGMLKIEVLTSSAGVSELEKKLILRYKIKQARIVRYTSDLDILVNIGRAASNYIIAILKHGDTIGITWGTTPSAMSNQLTRLNYRDVTIVPLIGGIGRNPEIMSNHIVTKIASSLNAQYFLLHAPAFTGGIQERDVFLNDPLINDTITRGEQADIAILGFGVLGNSTFLDNARITDKEINELKKLGAVGDIALRFIDKDGNIIKHNIHERLVAGDLKKIRSCAREVIGLAAGIEKAEVVRAALNGKWIDTLITDTDIAKELLK